jgi:hypothetical protein
MYTDDLRKAILQNKPDIKDNSLNLYMRNIKILHKRITGHDELKDLKFLDNFETVIDSLDKYAIPTQRNYISSIITVLQTTNNDILPLYVSYYKNLSTEYQNKINTQEKSEKQKENWVSLAELKKVKNMYKKQTMEIIKLDNPTKKQIDIIQRYLVCMLYIGSKNNPPLRLDFAPMLVRTIEDYDKESKKNILVIKNKTMFLHIGDYKTIGKYGTKIIPVSLPLEKVIKIYLKYNKSGFLLINTENTPMNANGLSKYLTKIFEPTGKKISATMLRHVFLSETFPADLKKRAEIADKMGHSVSMGIEYSKK